MSAIGARLPRKEDRRMLLGDGRFGDDFSARGQVWARIVRSPVAHGRIRAVDAAPARRAAGVVCAITAVDLPPGLVIPVRLAVQGIDLSRFLQPVLAADVVRYVGEPLAVVLADDPYAAEDAAELVDIDIEEAPAVLDARAAALAKRAPPVRRWQRCCRLHSRLWRRGRCVCLRGQGRGDRDGDRAAHGRTA